MTDARITDFLQQLNIRSVSIGGYDKVDTLEAFKSFSQLWETVQTEESARQEQARTDMELQQSALWSMCGQVEQAYTEFKSKVDEQRAQTTAMENELEGLRRELTGEKEKNIRLQEENSRERLKTKARDEALGKREQELEERVTRAEEDAKKLIKDAQIEIMRKKAAVNMELKQVRREKESILEQLQTIQDEIEQMVLHANCPEKHG